MFTPYIVIASSIARELQARWWCTSASYGVVPEDCEDHALPPRTRGRSSRREGSAAIHVSVNARRRPAGSV